MNQYDTPLFVTNYPLEIKAFYMPEDPAHPGTAKCSDLLAPEGYGEVIGGSERLGDYDLLKQRVLDRGYDLEEYKWYLDTRKYG
jgi:asparaginyl-tRNA synthetase